jgi:hypothetical protein
VAKVHQFEFEDRAECLDAFAESYGQNPPVGDVPKWWLAFEEWYQAEIGKARDGVVSITLRTETTPYEDDEEEEEEPESAGEGTEE